MQELDSDFSLRCLSIFTKFTLNFLLQSETVFKVTEKKGGDESFLIYWSKENHCTKAGKFFL